MFIMNFFKFKRFFYCVIFCFISLFFSSCEHTNISELPPEEGYARIKKDYDDSQFTSVTEEVDQFKARHPYSKYVNELDYMQADSYFKSKKYTEAIFSYEDYIRKNPSAPNLFEAYYRIAKSYDKQSSEDVDRDQANTKKAVEKYNQYLELYPKTQYADESKERLVILNKRVVESMRFVANFYFEKEMYGAALSRYLDIINRYKDYSEFINLSKKRASICYNELAKILEKDPKSDSFVFFRDETVESLKKKAQSIMTTN